MAQQPQNSLSSQTWLQERVKKLALILLVHYKEAIFRILQTLASKDFKYTKIFNDFKDNPSSLWWIEHIKVEHVELVMHHYLQEDIKFIELFTSKVTGAFEGKKQKPTEQGTPEFHPVELLQMASVTHADKQIVEQPKLKNVGIEKNIQPIKVIPEKLAVVPQQEQQQQTTVTKSIQPIQVMQIESPKQQIQVNQMKQSLEITKQQQKPEQVQKSQAGNVKQVEQSKETLSSITIDTILADQPDQKMLDMALSLSKKAQSKQQQFASNSTFKPSPKPLQRMTEKNEKKINLPGQINKTFNPVVDPNIGTELLSEKEQQDFPLDESTDLYQLYTVLKAKYEQAIWWPAFDDKCNRAASSEEFEVLLYEKLPTLTKRWAILTGKNVIDLERNPNKRHRTPLQDIKGSMLDYSDHEGLNEEKKQQILPLEKEISKPIDVIQEIKLVEQQKQQPQINDQQQIQPAILTKADIATIQKHSQEQQPAEQLPQEQNKSQKQSKNDLEMKQKKQSSNSSSREEESKEGEMPKIHVQSSLEIVQQITPYQIIDIEEEMIIQTNNETAKKDSSKIVKTATIQQQQKTQPQPTTSKILSPPQLTSSIAISDDFGELFKQPLSSSDSMQSSSINISEQSSLVIDEEKTKKSNIDGLEDYYRSKLVENQPEHIFPEDLEYMSDSNKMGLKILGYIEIDELDIPISEFIGQSVPQPSQDLQEFAKVIFNILKYMSTHRFCVVIDVIKQDNDYIGTMNIRPIQKKENEVRKYKGQDQNLVNTIIRLIAVKELSSKFFAEGLQLTTLFDIAIAMIKRLFQGRATAAEIIFKIQEKKEKKRKQQQEAITKQLEASKPKDQAQQNQKQQQDNKQSSREGLTQTQKNQDKRVDQVKSVKKDKEKKKDGEREKEKEKVKEKEKEKDVDKDKDKEKTIKDKTDKQKKKKSKSFKGENIDDPLKLIIAEKEAKQHLKELDRLEEKKIFKENNLKKASAILEKERQVSINLLADQPKQATNIDKEIEPGELNPANIETKKNYNNQHQSNPQQNQKMSAQPQNKLQQSQGNEQWHNTNNQNQQKKHYQQQQSQQQQQINQQKKRQQQQQQHQSQQQQQQQQPQQQQQQQQQKSDQQRPSKPQAQQSAYVVPLHKFANNYDEEHIESLQDYPNENWQLPQYRATQLNTNPQQFSYQQKKEQKLNKRTQAMASQYNGFPEVYSQNSNQQYHYSQNQQYQNNQYGYPQYPAKQNRQYSQYYQNYQQPMNHNYQEPLIRKQFRNDQQFQGLIPPPPPVISQFIPEQNSSYYQQSLQPNVKEMFAELREILNKFSSNA